MELTGLHHVTAVTADAPRNLDFYAQTLGLRLVKKTVNQDDVSAYHLFYGDESGAAGTEVTFFDWPRVGRNSPGSGEISRIALRVDSPDALDWWAQRLSDHGAKVGPVIERAGRSLLEFTDPEGQRLQLVSDNGAPGGRSWDKSPVPADRFIKGLDGVTLTVHQLDRTERLLTGPMNMKRTCEYEIDSRPVVVFEMGPGGPGAEVHVAERPDLPRGFAGAGGVHHVAFRTPNASEQREWQRLLHEAGVGTSGIVDRFYFQSLYFREPGGNLFEIATDGPGFASDEPGEHLGETLSLPPFLEGRRKEIEAGLTPLNSVSVG